MFVVRCLVVVLKNPSEAPFLVCTSLWSMLVMIFSWGGRWSWWDWHLGLYIIVMLKKLVFPRSQSDCFWQQKLFLIAVIYFFVLGKKDDYERWVPHGEGSNQGCLLGKKVTIQRLKKEALYVTFTCSSSCTLSPRPPAKKKNYCNQKFVTSFLNILDIILSVMLN